MALLQALLAWIGRSAGRIVNAIFDWAVRALFGFVSGTQKALLTGVVAFAALWPLLVLGVAFPRIASFLVAFVPIPEGVPDRILRAIWLGLALFAPTLLGLVLAARGDRRESLLVRAARGYPTTLGLSLAFWISFVSVPLQRLASALRGRSDVYVPLVTTENAYRDAALRIERRLNARGFALVRSEPGFWAGLPMRILARLAGRALATHLPRDVAHLRGPGLEATLYPAGLVLRGREAKTALAHGLVVEALANSDAFQTTSPETQAIEREIRRVWSLLDRHRAHIGSSVLESRLEEIGEEIATLEVPYDDWQTVYRQALQLGRALDGEPQLLSIPSLDEGEFAMEPDKPHIPVSTSPGLNDTEQLSTLALVREITTKALELVRKELELARSELKHDVRAELGSVKTLGAAAVLGVVAVTLFFVAGVFALATVMPAWAAALAVGGGTAVVAGIAAAIGWSRRVTQPLAITRKTVEEDVEWAKERLA
jgi:hypothetical protein